jgi:type I restriction enzyme, S subunit
MEALSSSSMFIDGIELRSGNSGSKFKNGDTLLARITPCIENGKTAYIQFLPSGDDVAFGSTEFIVLRSKTLCPEYVYLLARSKEFRDNAIKSMTGASGRQRVQKSCFDKFLIAQPNPSILSKFTAVLSPMFHYVHILTQKNKNLRETLSIPSSSYLSSSCFSWSAGLSSGSSIGGISRSSQGRDGWRRRNL